ncbi:MAG: CoA pyrophosphatase [Deltaproteobacteria bacterium]
MNSIPRPSALKPSDSLLARIADALVGDVAPSSDFDLNPGITAPKALRAAAVLLPLINTPKGWQLILTKRAVHLTNHPGQIALPGGRLDPGETVAEAALRESDEEIGLAPARVSLLGELPMHHTVTAFNVTPLVGIVSGDIDFRPTSPEVDEVFAVPLSDVLAVENYRIEARHWNGVRRQYYTVPVGPWYIWGATARILKQLADIAAR